MKKKLEIHEMPDGYLERLFTVLQDGSVGADTNLVSPSSAQDNPISPKDQAFTIALKDPNGKVYQRTIHLRPGSSFFSKKGDNDEGLGGKSADSKSVNSGAADDLLAKHLQPSFSQTSGNTDEDDLHPCFSQRPPGDSSAHQSEAEPDNMLSQKHSPDDGSVEAGSTFFKRLPGTPMSGRQVFKFVIIDL